MYTGSDIDMLIFWWEKRMPVFSDGLRSLVKGTPALKVGRKAHEVRHYILRAQRPHSEDIEDSLVYLLDNDELTKALTHEFCVWLVNDLRQRG